MSEHPDKDSMTDEERLASYKAGWEAARIITEPQVMETLRTACEEASRLIALQSHVIEEQKLELEKLRKNNV